MVINLSDRLIHVMMKFDKNRVDHARVTLVSASESLDPGYRLVVHIIHDNLSENDKTKLLDMTKLCENIHQVNLYNFDEYISKELQLDDYISPRWGRTISFPLYESLILPNRVHRTIHLDEDLIINKSLHHLWIMDTFAPYIAVPELIPNNVLRYDIQDLDVLSVIPDFDPKKYTNCGVVVMNLDYVREHKLFDRYLELARTGKFIWLEQSIFNVVYYDNTLNPGFEWNYPPMYEWERFTHSGRQLVYKYNEDNPDILDYMIKLKSNRSKIGIIHYYGWFKPWVIENDLDPVLRSYWVAALDSLFYRLYDNNRDTVLNIEISRYDMTKFENWKELSTKEDLIRYYKLNIK